MKTKSALCLQNSLRIKRVKFVTALFHDAQHFYQFKAKQVSYGA